MHFEILVEDCSGKKTLEALLPKLIGDKATYRVHSYKGVGRIPKNMKDAVDADKRILLDNLPKLLKGFGKTFDSYPAMCPAAVVLVCDLDAKCRRAFRQELLGILDACHPKPRTQFCIAIEESEAWFLGDRSAIMSAYPHCRLNILDSYVNDSICGTWEKLADAVCSGGSGGLIKKGWQAVGKEKSKWAEAISPKMNVDNNSSPSFCYFRDKIRALADGVESHDGKSRARQ